MTFGSRAKGASAEREFAALIRQHGFACERTGRNGRTAEDVTHDVPGVWLEVKRREALELAKWLRQAEKDAGDLVPVVAFRKSREPWRVVIPAAEWLRLKQLERDVETVRQGMRNAA
jgi:Holliday junction resolvase